LASMKLDKTPRVAAEIIGIKTTKY
jgi:hypothetical protein